MADEPPKEQPQEGQPPQQQQQQQQQQPPPGSQYPPQQHPSQYPPQQHPSQYPPQQHPSQYPPQQQAPPGYYQPPPGYYQPHPSQYPPQQPGQDGQPPQQAPPGYYQPPPGYYQPPPGYYQPHPSQYPPQQQQPPQGQPPQGHPPQDGQPPQQQQPCPAPTATTWNAIMVIASARGMAKSMFSGNPRVVVKVGGMEFKTAEKKMSSSSFPKWGDEFVLKGIVPGTLIAFDIFKAKSTTPIMVGEYAVTEGDLAGDLKEIHIPITPPASKGSPSSSSLHISIFFYKEMGGGGGRSIRYTIHTSTMFGVLSWTKSQQGTAAWPCYVIMLNDVPEVFGNEKQAWNRDYDAAKKIFGPGGQAEVVRSGIRSQHAALYRNRGNADKVGDISCGDQLFSMLRNGVRRGRMRYFTYAITENKFCFSETGAKFGKDFMSKHAMHANCAEQVVYAGEFTISKNLHNGNLILVIDNNSGTYAPNKLLLPKLKELMERNFPATEIVAISYDDPLMAVYKDRTKAVDSVRTADDW